DQHGETLSLDKFKGQVKILTFAFAHCQTVCPLLVTKALQASKSFKNKTVPVLIITLDPWRDTPKSLPFLAKKWNLPDSAHVLSGEIKTVNKVIESFGVPTKRNEKDGDIQHPEVSFIIDQNNKIAFILNKAPTKWLIQAVKRVQAEIVVFRDE
ncbi:MAG: SCO family protein, partial [Bdellovibrionales bacterium]|nr:SCO family protein [Bdellovibrionales bacterium]